MSHPLPCPPRPLRSCTAADPQYGETPLYWAGYNGLKEVALALIEKGANVDAADKVSGHGMVGLWRTGGCVRVHIELMGRQTDERCE